MPTSTLSAVPLVVQFLAPIGTEEESALLVACTLAHENGSCTTAPAHVESGFRATVESTSTDHVLLEVTGTGENSSLFASREMAFRPEDDPLERARSIGLALGVLATTLLQNRSSIEEAEEEPRPSGPKQSTRREQTKRPARKLPSLFLGLAAGPVVAPSLGKVGPSVGAFGRLSPLTPLSLQARLQGWILSAHEAPRLTQLSPLVGAGVTFPVRTMALGSSLNFGAEFLRADVGNRDGSTARAARVVPLVAWDVTWGVPWADFAWFFVAPQAAFALSPTELFLNETQTGTTGVVRLTLNLELAFAVGAP